MLFSELYQKEVFRLDGTALGAVVGAIFDKETCCLQGICAEKGIFAIDDMYAAKDVVTLKQQSEDMPLPIADEHMFLTADMPVYDCKGEWMGKMIDFYIDPHNKKEEIFMTENNQFMFKKLLFTANGAAMINQGDQLPRKRRTKRATDKTIYDNVVFPVKASFVATDFEIEISNQTNPSAKLNKISNASSMPQVATTSDTVTNRQESALPDPNGTVIDYKNYGDYRFLMGRVLIKPIYDLNHNLVISAGTVVTPDIVELAKLRGKLTELTKHSK